MAGRSASLRVFGVWKKLIRAFRCNGEYDGTGDLEYTGILWDIKTKSEVAKGCWKKINSSLEVVTLMLTMKQFLNVFEPLDSIHLGELYPPNIS